MENGKCFRKSFKHNSRADFNGLCTLSDTNKMKLAGGASNQVPAI